MTPILPPDKLREILDTIDLDPYYAETIEGRDEAAEAIQALATDALVAELNWVIMNFSLNELQLADIRERIAQLTTVPESGKDE